MLILKLFLPLSLPGWSSLGLGILAVASGTYNAVQVIAIVLGLMVVAVAGVFTIRSNVAKIWREQAEGEKARNVELAAHIAELMRDHAAETAALRLDQASGLAAVLRDLETEKAAKEVALAALAESNKRTDQAPVLELLHLILATLNPANGAAST